MTKPTINKTMGSDMRSLAACAALSASARPRVRIVRALAAMERRTCTLVAGQGDAGGELVELADVQLGSESVESRPGRFTHESCFGQGLAEFGERPALTAGGAERERAFDSGAAGESYSDEVEEAAECVAEGASTFGGCEFERGEWDDRAHNGENERDPQWEDERHRDAAGVHDRNGCGRPQEAGERAEALSCDQRFDRLRGDAQIVLDPARQLPAGVRACQRTADESDEDAGIGRFRTLGVRAVQVSKRVCQRRSRRYESGDHDQYADSNTGAEHKYEIHLRAPASAGSPTRNRSGVRKRLMRASHQSATPQQIEMSASVVWPSALE